MDYLSINGIKFFPTWSKKILEIIKTYFEKRVTSLFIAQSFLDDRNSIVIEVDSKNKIFQIQIDQEYYSNLNHFEKICIKKSIIKYQTDDNNEIIRLDELKYDTQIITINCARSGSNKISIPREQNVQYLDLLAQNYKIVALSDDKKRELLNNTNLVSFKINMEKEI